MPSFIQTNFRKIDSISDLISEIFKDIYNLSNIQISRSLPIFNSYISHFRNDIFGLVEFPLR